MIRKAEINDLEYVVLIEKSVFSSPWTYNQFIAEFEKDFSEFYVYEKNSQIMGYVILWDLGESVEIADIAVKKEIQGKGYAKLLLDCALKKCKFNKDCFLEVSEKNQRAINFYKKNGFEQISIRKDYYGKNENALIMKLTKKEVTNA